MAMMFFVSGLFAPASLRRKGPLRFVADRLARLGLPFLFNVLLLMPIAIYPVYHLLTPQGSLGDYAAAYWALPFLPNGPTWFLWLLIAFSLVAATAYMAIPALYPVLGRAAALARRRPQAFLVGLSAAAVVAYLPLALIYNSFDWTERGPFSFQVSRPLLYGAFFFAGAAVGVGGIGGGLLAPDGVLTTRWRRILILSPSMLFLWMGLTGVTLAWPTFAPLAMASAVGTGLCRRERIRRDVSAGALGALLRPANRMARATIAEFARRVRRPLCAAGVDTIPAAGRAPARRRQSRDCIFVGARGLARHGDCNAPLEPYRPPDRRARGARAHGLAASLRAAGKLRSRHDTLRSQRGANRPSHP